MWLQRLLLLEGFGVEGLSEALDAEWAVDGAWCGGNELLVRSVCAWALMLFSDLVLLEKRCSWWWLLTACDMHNSWCTVGLFEPGVCCSCS